MAMGQGISTLVLASMCLLHSSGPVALDEGMDWSLPTPAFMSFLASTWPQPNLAPINAVFGEESGQFWITLHTSPVTLAEEVLTLGVDLGEADRVVSAADEETFMVGIIPSTTTHDGWEGGFTTKGCSSSPRCGKAGKPATFGLIEVGNGVPGDWEKRGRYLRPTIARVVLSCDQSCTPWLAPL